MFIIHCENKHCNKYYCPLRKYSGFVYSLNSKNKKITFLLYFFQCIETREEPPLFLYTKTNVYVIIYYEKYKINVQTDYIFIYEILKILCCNNKNLCD